jgi:DNA-binding CsgD family transcriptional regulator
MSDAFSAEELQSIFAGKTIKLTDRESHCVRQVIQGQTFQQIADGMNVTTERIRQIVAKAARKAGYRPPPSSPVEMGDFSPYVDDIEAIFQEVLGTVGTAQSLSPLKKRLAEYVESQVNVYKND